MGKTIREILTGEAGPLLAIEFDVWCEYRTWHGLDTERIEGAIAIGSWAIRAAWGGKGEPQDLLPAFRPKDASAGSNIRELPPEVFAVVLGSIPGAVVTFIPDPKPDG